MNRLVVGVLALAGLLAVSPVVAAAGPTKSISYTLTGSSQWNAVDLPSEFTIGGDVVDGSRTVGTYSGTLTAGTFGPCADNPYGPLCAPVTGGTITFALRGGTVTATVDGGTVWQAFQTPSHDEYVFDVSLSVTGGTHAYASAEGTLSLHYDTARSNLALDPVTGVPCGVVDITSCPITDTGTLTGTITR